MTRTARTERTQIHLAPTSSAAPAGTPNYAIAIQGTALVVAQPPKSGVGIPAHSVSSSTGHKLPATETPKVFYLPVLRLWH